MTFENWKYAGKLVCRLGQFPENLDFPDSFFDGFYNARLLHFFGGDRIQASLIKFYRWLKPGGRVFLVNRCLREGLALETLPSNKADVLWVSTGFFLRVIDMAVAL
jgi:ubiquinone/menaquinone biosynthesis C-methylase UbiE